MLLKLIVLGPCTLGLLIDYTKTLKTTSEYDGIKKINWESIEKIAKKILFFKKTCKALQTEPQMGKELILHCYMTIKDLWSNSSL